MVQNQNMINLISMMKQSANPEQAIIGMMKNYSSSNPLLGNLLTLAINNDTKGIETIARNMAKEKGINYDNEFNSFKQMFGL